MYTMLSLLIAQNVLKMSPNHSLKEGQVWQVQVRKPGRQKGSVLSELSLDILRNGRQSP